MPRLTNTQLREKLARCIGNAAKQNVERAELERTLANCQAEIALTLSDLQEWAGRVKGKGDDAEDAALISITIPRLREVAKP